MQYPKTSFLAADLLGHDLAAAATLAELDMAGGAQPWNREKVSFAIEHTCNALFSSTCSSLFSKPCQQCLPFHAKTSDMGDGGFLGSGEGRLFWRSEPWKCRDASSGSAQRSGAAGTVSGGLQVYGSSEKMYAALKTLRFYAKKLDGISDTLDWEFRRSSKMMWSREEEDGDYDLPSEAASSAAVSVRPNVCASSCSCKTSAKKVWSEKGIQEAAEEQLREVGEVHWDFPKHGMKIVLRYRGIIFAGSPKEAAGGRETKVDHALHQMRI